MILNVKEKERRRGRERSDSFFYARGKFRLVRLKQHYAESRIPITIDDSTKSLDTDRDNLRMPGLVLCSPQLVASIRTSKWQPLGPQVIREVNREFLTRTNSRSIVSFRKAKETYRQRGEN